MSPGASEKTPCVAYVVHASYLAHFRQALMSNLAVLQGLGSTSNASASAIASINPTEVPHKSGRRGRFDEILWTLTDGRPAKYTDLSRVGRLFA
jgi:hypothetical protein